MKNYLKIVVDEKGSSVLTDPSAVAKQLKAKVDPDSSYPLQMELLLKVVNIGQLVQEPEKLKEQGRAAYNAMIVRAMKKTGFTIDLTKELMNHVVAAAGIRMEDIYHTNIQDLKKLSILSEDSKGEVRGREAYDHAKMLLSGDLKKDYVTADSANAAAQKQAVKFLRVAAADGCNVAYGLLAICYFNGIGVKRDYEEAYRCIMMPEALSEDFQNQKRSMIGKLYVMRQDIKKKKTFSLVLSAVTVVMMILMNVVVGCKIWSMLLLFAAGANLGVGFYEIIFQKGNLSFVEKHSAISAALWCLAFLLCI